MKTEYDSLVFLFDNFQREVSDIKDADGNLVKMTLMPQASFALGPLRIQNSSPNPKFSNFD